MAKHTLTDRFCKDAPHPADGQVLYFDAHPNAPAGFALRCTAGAKSWILNYYVDRKQRRLTLPVGYPAWGPTRARTEAAKIKTAIHAGADPLAERATERESTRQKAEANQAKRDRTLGMLLTLYADALEKAGKVSAGKVRAQVQLHVEQAHPRLWKTPAVDLQPEDGVEILSTLVDAGKMREAGKLRSTLRAAYAQAIRARLDASASSALRALGIRANPFADLAPIEGGSGAPRNRALALEELRAYWTRIAALDGSGGALLRFHLLTGGQRVEQLARATVRDLDRDTATLVLQDTKGRRKKPRPHTVPLVEEALDALEAMAPNRRGDYLVTITEGRHGIDYASLAYRLRDVAATMVEAGEAVSPFTAGDLRRTVETRLAAAGVSKEVRAQLQSHGLGGVQDQHYDRHSYLEEKRAALETLRDLCTAKPATVTPITARKKSGTRR